VPRYYKLSFLMHDDKEHPLGWLNRCEHFFRAQRTRDADKVWLASFHMTGPAQHWYYMLERDAGNISWHTFKAFCQQQFGLAVGINHRADLAQLPFRGSVNDYQDTFLAKMAHVGHLSQEQQVSLFTGGLPDAIRVDVELQAPRLQRAMALALAYEQRSSALAAVASAGSPPRPPSRFRHQLGSSSVTPHSSASSSSHAAPTTPATPTTKPFKKLTPTEMLERRRLGLCYNCDDQYTRGHKCPKLFYLEVADNDDDTPDGQEQHAADEPLISLHAIAGVRTDDTMQVRVQVGEKEFIALIDTGSTHNFSVHRRRKQLNFNLSRARAQE
jgi:hypothetical protein